MFRLHDTIHCNTRPLLAALVAILLWQSTAKANQRPVDLNYVAVGIARYNGGESNLRWAAKDARDMAAILNGQQGKLFGQVRGVTLTDEKATAQAIRQALAWAATKANAASLTIIYFAGHGGLGELGAYGIPGHDYTPKRAQETEITWGELRVALDNIPGRVLLILDTCNAGQGTSHGIPPITQRGRDQPPNSVITLAGSLADQDGDEMDTLQHGIFTHALLEALAGKADANGDGIVTLAEVDVYVAAQVKKLSGGRQQTTLERPATVPSNLPLARLATALTRTDATQGRLSSLPAQPTGGISKLVPGVPLPH